MRQSSPVYMDNAATTPVRREVLDAMSPYMSEVFGNTSSTHQFGRAARAAIDQARRTIGDTLGVEADAVFFTSGGTEADNLAVIGRALAARKAGKPFRVAVSATEHQAVLGAAEAVEDLGGEAESLPVDANGHLDLDTLDGALDRQPAVVSVMWVNNEVGTIQDVATIAERCAAAGVSFHTDMVQAVGKIDAPLGALPISLAAIAGHKIGAPKGVGALICMNPDLVVPLLRGGSHQGGLRPGTENVAGAVGLAEAVKLAVGGQAAFAAHTRELREALEAGISERFPDAVVNGRDGTRAPHIANVGFPGAESGALLMHLDLQGIACSAGSACKSGTTAISHVLEAMDVPREIATGTIRFSFSKSNTMAEVERVLEVLPGVVARVRELNAVVGS
jgi:cysteine desulfurase